MGGIDGGGGGSLTPKAWREPSKNVALPPASLLFADERSRATVLPFAPVSPGFVSRKRTIQSQNSKLDYVTRVCIYIHDIV